MNDLLIFTPINPTRPFVEELTELHRLNVQDSIKYCEKQFKDYGVDYVEKECLLLPSMQNRGQCRGQNVIKNFNRVYEEKGADYRYLCKWDDDILLPPRMLYRAIELMERERAVGVGLLQENYGAPTILMVNQRKDGFIGSFQRFYIYKVKVWGSVPCTLGGITGDPDQPYQQSIQGKKIVLNTPCIHIDHRSCFHGKVMKRDLYKVLLDLSYFNYITLRKTIV